MAQQHHIFFVDDNAGMRKATAKILSNLDCEVSCFANAEDCLNQINSQECDLLITDVRMPGIDGLTLLCRTQRTAPYIPVMVITAYGDIAMAVRAMKMGAADFITKPFNRDDFLEKIQSILKQRDGTTSSISDLTKTEKGVLQLIVDGKCNKEIAYAIHRSTRTIEMHRTNIMHKLGAENAVDMTKKAIAMRLVSLKAPNGK